MKKLLFAVLAGLGILSLAVPAGAVTPPNHPDGSTTPWAVQLAIMDTQDQGFVHCSGSIVSSLWVLTARHCVENPVMSEAYADVGAGPSYKFPYRLTEIVKHPSYDVALVKLDHSPQRPSLALVDAPVAPGSNATFYGFGGSDVLTEALVQVVGTSWDGHLFARSPSGVKTVVGDSGGPLVSNDKIAGVLSAAVTYPYESFIPEDYKFVPSSVFRDWFLQTLGLAPSPQNPAPAGPANPAANPTSVPVPTVPVAPNRIAGSNRVQTSLAVWQQGGFISNAVVIATGRNAADALAAGPLAASMNAPLLLSTAATIEPTTVAEILNRGIREVYLVGGGLQFDPNSVAALGGRGIQVHSLAGADRFETAVLVARTVIEKWNLQGRLINPIFLADGINFPDALSAGAAGANLYGVVLLTNSHSMPPATAAFLGSRAASSPRLYAVGGPAYQAWNSSQPGGIPAVGLVGANRYHTAALLAANLTPYTTSALVVSGVNFPDGLSAAPLAARRNARLLLTSPSQLPPESATSLATLTQRQSSLVVGGAGAVSDAVAWAVLG